MSSALELFGSFLDDDLKSVESAFRDHTCFDVSFMLQNAADGGLLRPRASCGHLSKSPCQLPHIAVQIDCLIEKPCHPVHRRRVVDVPFGNALESVWSCPK